MHDTDERDQTAPAPADRPTPKPKGIDALIAGMSSWQALLAGAFTVGTAAVNLIVFLEKQWQLAAATLLTMALGALVYLIAIRREVLRGSSKAMRYAAAFVVFATIPMTAAVLFSIAVLPRLLEDGPIIAIARFDGPRLPAPYDDCRPSDMLADALTDVANRYHRIAAFELPYVVNPNGRWAGIWAREHGFFEGADVVVYGEYSLVDHALGTNKPDRLLISSRVSNKPIIPLGWKRAPLLEWQFPDRVVPIADLCTGTAARFITDGRRLGLALAASELFVDRQYVQAERAVGEAQALGRQGASACTGPAETSECSGVLAFYLAVLDQRFGRYDRAKAEYALAAEKLGFASPYINLAELYALTCDGKNALRALHSAVSADPSSVTALATLAQYEYEYGSNDDATLYLERAESSKVFNPYDTIALARALHQRGDAASKRRGLTIMRHAMQSRTFDTPTMIDTRTEYGSWLRTDGQPDAAIDQLSAVVRVQPDHIKANYELALALSAVRAAVHATAPDERSRLAAMIQRRFLLSLNGRAFTDDDYTNAGNAAAELQQFARARGLYGKALAVNPNAVYALSGRAKLYARTRQYELAVRDYAAAIRLHPREKMLYDELAGVRRDLRLGRSDRGRPNRNGRRFGLAIVTQRARRALMPDNAAAPFATRSEAATASVRVRRPNLRRRHQTRSSGHRN